MINDHIMPKVPTHGTHHYLSVSGELARSIWQCSNGQQSNTMDSKWRASLSFVSVHPCAPGSKQAYSS